MTHRDYLVRLIRPLAASVAALVVLTVLPAAAQADPDADYAAAMAKEHADDTPDASPAADVATPEAVKGTDVTYGTLAGREVRGYLARPAGEQKGRPGIIVIHEWWGLNGNIRSMARQLADEGYNALAVDLYFGESAASPESARKLMQKAMSNPRQLLENIKLAHEYLKRNGAVRTGSIGWCFGGGLSFEAGLMLGDQVDAVVMYYGRPVTDSSRLRSLQAPMLGFFGAEDRGIPVSQVGMLEAGLKELGKSAQIKVYSGAGHAFANPTGSHYQADAARDAWARTLAFFREQLVR